MLANKVRVLLLVGLLGASGLGLAQGSGRLCAPMLANTSAMLALGQSAVILQLPATPANGQQSAPDPQVTPPVPAEPQLAPAPKRAPIRIALMLPLRSESLGKAAEAVREGFLTAFERDRDNITLDLIETGDSAQETLDSYAKAVDGHDVLVGPLARSAVSAIAASPVIYKPTVALNHPDSARDIPLPQKLLVMGLSIEDEARQVANWADSEQRTGRAVIVSGTASWQRRIAQAFANHWKRLGRVAELVELTANNGYLGDASMQQLKLKLDGEPPALLFGALDAEQARQLRAVLGPTLPLYGTSSVNPGRTPVGTLAELDGLRLLDLPWQIQSDHPAVMVYPHPAQPTGSMDMERLYALGIDAFRVARELALHPVGNFQMDGVTGRLTVSFGNGAASFERVEPVTTYQGGAYVAVPATH